MHRLQRLVLLSILILTAGCTWTAPGPTYTPWPTLTPTATVTPGPAPVTPTLKPTQLPAPTFTPSQPEESDPMNPSLPDMPANPMQRNQMFTSLPPMIIDQNKSYQATIKTAKGDIVCELYAKEASQTVNNFVYLAKSGFYDGLTFHRVVPGFVIQGGDPLGNGTGGSGYTVPAEIGLPHLKGALATARLGDQVNPQRASSGSKFYITLDKVSHLDGGYTVFGQVVKGMQVVESIAIGDVIQEVTIVEQ